MEQGAYIQLGIELHLEQKTYIEEGDKDIRVLLGPRKKRCRTRVGTRSLNTNWYRTSFGARSSYRGRRQGHEEILRTEKTDELLGFN